MERLIWWLNAMSAVMVVTTIALLFTAFSDAVLATAFVPAQTGAALAVAGVIAYRNTGEKGRSDNVLRK